MLISSDIEKPTVALAFKLEDGQYGQLTYVRVYQGKLSKGDIVINARTQKKTKIGRLAKMHSNQMEDVRSLSTGKYRGSFLELIVPQETLLQIQVFLLL